MPLVMTHGWPGSVIEFMGVVEALTNPDDPAQAFHLVLPSLPGFAKPVPCPGCALRRPGGC